MIRVLSSLVLALVLAFTSQSMAVARGASAATGQMVLCTGTGPVAVYTDAQGQPTSAPHICPDASLLVLGDKAVLPVRAGGQMLLPEGLSCPPVGHRPALARPNPPSRAPPLPV